MTKFYPHLATDECKKSSEDQDKVFSGPVAICDADTKLVKFNIFNV